MTARAAVVGVAMSPVSRRGDAGLAELALEVSRAAIADAGLKPSDIDGIATVPRQPYRGAGVVEGVDQLTCATMARALHADVAWMSDEYTLVIEAFIAGYHAVAAGTCDNVLVFRALKNPPNQYGQFSGTSAAGRDQFLSPYGVEPIATAASIARRYLDRYGYTRAELGQIAVDSRANGLASEYGYWATNHPEPLTSDQYLDSRMIAEPLCLYDCDLPVDAAGAYVIAAADVARDLRDRPAFIHGVASNAFRSRYPMSTLEESMEVGLLLGRHLYRNAAISADRVTIANVYDGFAIYVPLWMEALGLVDEGKGLAAIAAGAMRPDASPRVNPSGGNQGCGRLHGITQITESVLQAMGRAGPRQIDELDAIVTTVGGLITISGGAVISPRLDLN